MRLGLETSVATVETSTVEALAVEARAGSSAGDVLEFVLGIVDASALGEARIA